MGKYYVDVDSIDNFRSRHRVPEWLNLRMPTENVESQDYIVDGTGFWTILFAEAGLRFPPARLFVEFFEYFEITHSQCCPNLFRILNGIVALNNILSIDLGINELRWCYRFVQSASDFWYISSRDRTRALVVNLPDSDKGFEENLLVATGDWEHAPIAEGAEPYTGPRCPRVRGDSIGTTEIKEMQSQAYVNLYLRSPYTREQKYEYLHKGLPLYRAAMTGDWETAQKIIDNDGGVVRARITEGGETALHLAASGERVHFVEKLIEKMTIQDMQITNVKGNTALCFAAAETNVQIVEMMINKNSKLPMIHGPTGVKPIYMAALSANGEIVDYLYEPSKLAEWCDKERTELLIICISSRLFDVALKMIRAYPNLAVAQNKNKRTALGELARMPAAFAGGNRNTTWRRFINSCRKQVHNGSLSESPAFELLKCILSYVLEEDGLEISDLIAKAPRLLLDAAEVGNIEFLKVVIHYFPDLIWTVDELKRSVFHIAILHRHQSIFNLIYELESAKILSTCPDDANNNMLHLAAKLAPQTELSIVSGAALQMQREKLWFTEVEKIVQPSYRNMKNNEGKTPQDIFTMEHKVLMEKGEEWMKRTATSSMLVATIIASVVFTSIFTVPGGIIDKTGVPNMLNKAFFKVFYLSEAISMLSSLGSILMFFSILTSRYAETDFVHSLPFRLLIGVTTLLVSLAAMAVAFCATIFLSYHHGFPYVLIVLSLFSCVPLMFVLLKFRLLVDIIRSTYFSHFLFRSENRLFHGLP